MILYQTEDGKTKVDVRLQDDTVWLTQKQMSELFQKDVRTVSSIFRICLKRRSWKRIQLSGISG